MKKSMGWLDDEVDIHNSLLSITAPDGVLPVRNPRTGDGNGRLNILSKRIEEYHGGNYKPQDID